jgi:hypothetical protein
MSFKCAVLSVLSVLSVLAVLAVGSGVSHAQTLTVSATEAFPGETTRVKVLADAGVKSVNGIQFTLDYTAKTPSDAPDLVLNNEEGDISAPMFPGAFCTVNPVGTTVKAAIAGINVKSGPGTVFSVPFTVPADAPEGAKYVLKVKNVVFSYAEPNSTAPTLKEGSVTVKSVPPVLGVTAGEGSGYPGGEATLNVYATDLAQNVAGVQFVLHYDPSLTVSAEDVEGGGFLSGAPTVNLLAPGALKVAIASATGKNGPGILAKVTFHLPVNAAVGQEYPVTVSDLVMAAGGGGNIKATATDGKLTVIEKPGPVAIEGGLISVESLKVLKGQTGFVTVRVNDKIANVSGASFRLVFSTKNPSDAPDLKYAGEEAEGGIIPGAGPQVNTSVDGEVSVALASTNAGSGPGALVVLPFTVPADAPTDAVYTLARKAVIYSINDEDYTSAAEGGTLTVTGRRKGDVDNAENSDHGDDQIDTRDAIALLRIIVKMLTDPSADQLAAADANCDGEISVSDVVKILKIVVGLEEPCDQP